MSATQICGMKYERPDGKMLICTFPLGHDQEEEDPTPHSWLWAKREDQSDDLPSDIEVLIENIAAGRADQYLEAILAAGHGRKRALRNVVYPYGRRLVSE